MYAYRATKLNRGFTLIELLVVISIVSLLASVVMASLNTARDKAKAAVTLQFDTSMYHTYGAGRYENYGTGSYYFNGKIDDVRVYSQSLLASDIWDMYAATAPEHGVAVHE